MPFLLTVILIKHMLIKSGYIEYESDKIASTFLLILPYLYCQNGSSCDWYPIDKKQLKVMKRYVSSVEEYKSESQISLLVSVSFAIL